MSDKKMVVDYATHYEADYWQRKKTYRDHTGKTKVYQGPSLTWDGFQLIADTVAPLVQGKSLLDIGCSSGDFAKRFLAKGYDAYGVDVSEYAVRNAVPEMEGRLSLDDITTCPKEMYPWHGGREIPVPPFPATFDLVMATDLLEHIYEEDLDRTFDWIISKSNRWLFFLVATAQHPSSPLYVADKHEFCHKKGEPIPPEWEATAVAGHVNVRHWTYWAKLFTAKGLRIRWDKMYRLQMVREMDKPWQATMGWNLQTTWILQKGTFDSYAGEMPAERSKGT